MFLGRARPTAETLSAAERLKAWTRSRFRLGEDDAVMAAEVECGLPGCPPLETVVAFWAGETRHQFKLFKRLAEVAEADLPPAWLKPDLVDDGTGVTCC
jgi:hypothetical protein